jgi:MATE family multidrug resistance protein
MQFTDRIFSAILARAIARPCPAGIASFLFVSFLLGAVRFTGVLVSPYTRETAGQSASGTAIWQGLYFLVRGLGSPAAGRTLAAVPLFAWPAHPPEFRPWRCPTSGLSGHCRGLPILEQPWPRSTPAGLTRVVMVRDLVAR